MNPIRPRLIGLLLLLAATLAGAWQAPRVLLAAWLAAWWTAYGLVMGAAICRWVHGLTGGRWGEALAPAAARLAAGRLWLAPAFLPIVFGLPLLYPWAADAQATFAELERPHFAMVWFSPVFVGLRLLAYLVGAHLLAASLALPRIGRRRAATHLMLYGLLGSLAAVDLLMSLTTGWRSTGFGLLALSVQWLGGAAAVVGWTAWRQPQLLRAPSAREVPLARDLGNLLLMTVLLWAYLAFMQFLIIWAENLPSEISWYVPRLQTGWVWAGIAMIVLQLVLPTLGLVMRSWKDRPARLGMIAGLLLVATALNGAWSVVPSVDGAAIDALWLVPLCMAGMGLLVFGQMLLPIAPPANAARDPQGAPDDPMARSPAQEVVHGTR